MGRFPDNEIEISGGVIRDKNLHGNLPAGCLQVNHLIPSSVKDAGDDPLEMVSALSRMVLIRSGSQCWKTSHPRTASTPLKEMMLAVFSQLSV